MRLALVLLVLGLLVWAVPPQAALASPDLSAFNIQIRDLPPGVTPKAHFNLTPDQWDRTEQQAVGTSAKAGMTAISFLIFDFGPKADHLLVGLVAHYVTTAAAHRAYLVIVASIKPTLPHSPQSLAVVGIGSEQYGFTAPGRNASSSPVGGVYFRRGQYVVAVGVSGYAFPVTPILNIHLARLVDTRIQHAR